MKRNKIMALTALLTLIGAPLSKAQEKGGSQQSTSAQSEKIANKDSKATEQVKNQGKSKDSKALQTKDSKAVDKTKDSKAPQQTKDSKTVDKTKEQTKDSNKDGKKEQDKGSKKDDKKQQTKNSNPTDSKKVLENRVTTLGYTWEQIKKNWPWLAAMGGTSLFTGVVSNKAGKNANVNEKVQQMVSADYMTKADVNANYTKNDDKDGILAKAAVFGVKHTDNELQTKAQQLAAAELDNKVTAAINQKIASKALFKAADVNANYMTKTVVNANYTKNDDKDGILAKAAVFGVKHTDNELQTKAQQLAATELDNKVTAAINQKIASKALFKAADVNANYMQKTVVNANYTKNDDRKGIIEKAAVFGVKHTDNDLQKQINAAVSKAKSMGLLTRFVDESKKKPFDDYVKEIDKQLQRSLRNIQKALGESFQSIFAATTLGDDVEVPNDKVVDALDMLADIKNALVDKQAVNFKAKFANSDNGENDQSWSDFYFYLGSKKYNVYIKHTENEEIVIGIDEDKYRISLGELNLELEENAGGGVGGVVKK